MNSSTNTTNTTSSQALPELPRWRTLRRFAGNRLALIGALIIGLLIVLALAAPLLAHYDPIFDQDYGNLLAGPSAEHWLGTDDLGRDIYTRMLFGSRISLQAALISVGLAFSLGVPIGIVSGYYRGAVDAIVMRVVDALQAFPSLILALALAAALGGGFYNAMVAVGIGFTSSFVRLARGQAMTIRNLDYVMAARSIGAGHLRIMWRYILPNSLAPLVIQATFAMGTAIIAEAGLSYLGLGAKPEDPSWGSMLHIAQGYLNTTPMLAMWPGLAIFLVVLGFNLLGDGIREVFDPKLSR
ncbi:ABC transporter permease [Herbaspirillum sp. BH-1]|uniref:Dipeptide ABC transporter n=2 Tax=Herbaspirillum frisingense TaxID=92645 RepID=A0AAI9IEJ3_9BURK|nr:MULTISPECIES: ABC transporter permease [Herbaspirillum]EOA04634.1 dipeptide ABC transporter [Herbaspirillum frisingense GSF30]MDR6581894.1 peptide/nickel transport system permease protein [Herbaspirillum frisingense]ONN63687.1 diguanylate cyclase [Herbaspirillum sp. VT-16-41]PLY57061.1 ABC transporter permease [Herbaspirillum sp. BH-1]UIN23240.1 ABC transporter permease [Herbaspirillum frisingense]